MQPLSLAHARLLIAKPDISALLSSRERQVLRRSDLADMLESNRDSWRLAKAETLEHFIGFLIDEGNLRIETLDLPFRKEVRYTWGEVPLYGLLQGMKERAYFSHYTAMYFHGLTEQVPKRIYLNDEQTPKPAPTGGLTQQGIDAAFKRAARETTNRAKLRGYEVCVVSGKHTGGGLGVVPVIAPDGSSVRATGVERTLVDIAVRPNYAGGPFEVLKAFRLAREKLATSISANRLRAILTKLDHIYPYHQAIGFYLERAGYSDTQVGLFRREAFEFDFYLAHGMKQTEYSERWRLFYPKGM